MTMFYKYHSIVWSVGNSITNEMNEKTKQNNICPIDLPDWCWLHNAGLLIDN